MFGCTVIWTSTITISSYHILFKSLIKVVCALHSPICPRKTSSILPCMTPIMPCIQYKITTNYTRTIIIILRFTDGPVCNREKATSDSCKCITRWWKLIHCNLWWLKAITNRHVKAAFCLHSISIGFLTSKLHLVSIWALTKFNTYFSIFWTNIKKCLLFWKYFHILSFYNTSCAKWQKARNVGNVSFLTASLFNYKTLQFDTNYDMISH